VREAILAQQAEATPVAVIHDAAQARATAVGSRGDLFLEARDPPLVPDQRFGVAIDRSCQGLEHVFDPSDILSVSDVVRPRRGRELSA